MAIFYGQLKALNNLIQAVTFKLRVEAAAKFNRAQGRGVIADTDSLKFLFQKAVIKARIVGHQSAAIQVAEQFVGYLRKQRCAAQHARGYAGQLLNKRR